MESKELLTPAPSSESLGIPSRAILNFLQRIDAERIGMHGFLLVRRNRIAAEGYWAPWSADRKDRMYSFRRGASGEPQRPRGARRDDPAARRAADPREP